MHLSKTFEMNIEKEIEHYTREQKETGDKEAMKLRGNAMRQEKKGLLTKREM